MKRFLLIVVLLVASPAVGQNYRYEVENALPQDLHSVNVSTATAGYSGTGYLTNFDSQSNSDYFELKVDVPDGLYEMWVGYRSQYGPKGYEFWVDSEHGSGTFDQTNSFSVDRAGLFNVTGGINTLGIRESWGYYDVDYLEFRPYTPPAIQPIAPQLTDHSANQNTQMLMNYLTGIYGQKTLAGHQHNSSQNEAFPSSTYLNLSGGLKPAIRSSDFIEYSPTRKSHGSNSNNESEQSIAWAKQNNGILSMNWHWNAPANLVDTQCGSNCGANDYPWWKGFYTQGTTFNLSGALANTNGSDYQLLLRDIDAISRQLVKFQDAGVPVIWRPLHEAQGNANGTSGTGAWFWWGAAGPDNFKQLWRLMYNRMTTPHEYKDIPAGGQFPGLHNLIWEYTSSAAKSGWLNWYPGDDVVDMVGLDVYTDAASSMSGEWYDVLAQYNGRKMVSLSESGTLPNASAMNNYNIAWDYYSMWTDSFLDDFSAQQVQTLLNDNRIITLNELPTLPWSNSAPIAGDFNHNGAVDIGDYIVWRKSQGQTGWGLAADSDLNGRIDSADYAAWRSHFGQPPGTGSNASVPEPPTLVLFLAVVVLFAFRRTQ